MWQLLIEQFRGLRPHLYSLLGFALSAVIVALVAPGTQGFKYQFAKGRPWQYELLTAPYDFPIYKTEAEITRGQDSIRKAMRPVFSLDSSTEEMMLNELDDEYRSRLAVQIPQRYHSYVRQHLSELYSIGLMGADQLQELRSKGVLEIQLRKGDVLERKPITQFYSLKEGYDKVITSRPSSLDLEVLERMDIGRFLRENIVYDEALTETMLAEELSKLSPSVGLVQQGERIIGRGEIITPHLYNVLRSLAQEHNERSGGSLQHHSVRIGVFVVVGLLLISIGMYLLLLVPGFAKTGKNMVLLQTATLLFVILTAINARYELFNVYVIPYVMLPILLRIFFNGYTALVAFIAVVLSSALFVAEPLSFVLVQMIAGVAALVSMQKLSSRAQMIKAAFVVYITYSISSIGITLATGGEINAAYWIVQFYFAVNLIFLMFTYILAFVVERAFGYVSNVSLVELSDVNTPLLRELSEVAPGTFQHSLQVSILASEAAAKVGGDVSLIRTGALYHDIGKIKNPAYFTENQGGSNPHDLLPQDESARIIIRHITDGIMLAQKHNLPTQIIDFIRTHHGAGLVRYFYNTYCNQHPDLEVDPTPFTYPGPNPWTKEQGILMLADAVEASSRSLKEYTEQSIRQHVARIIDSIVAEGYLNDTPITFHDLQIIKQVFTSKLLTMYHTRISYPDKR